MIKRFMLEDGAAPGGRLDVLIVSSSREEMLVVVDEVARCAWRGRIVYYDPPGRGGVDLLINPSSDRDRPFAVSVSRSIRWGDPEFASAPVLREQVRAVFSTFNLRPEPSRQEDAEGSPAVVHSPVPAQLPARPRGQLSLF